MQIVAISDTHLAHTKQKIDIPEGDVLIHAGDATRIGSEKEIRVFNKWFSALGHPIKIFVAGNHDRLFETRPKRARALLRPSIHYLEDSEITIDGLRIYGSPWQPAFNNWAFNLKRGKALREKWSRIPSGIDILVTHSPPYGIGDTFPGSGPIGCADLAWTVRKIRPRYHIFGHVHHSHGIYTRTGSRTVYVNAALLDESYCPVHEPIVLEI